MKTLTPVISSWRTAFTDVAKEVEISNRSVRGMVFCAERLND